MATKNRRLGLGYGEFEPEAADNQSDHQISGYTAGFRFLRVVRKRYPEVLNDLATFPLDRVSELAQEGPDIQWVRDWANRHGLRFDLVVRVAAWTLAEWAENPRARELRKWALDRVEWWWWEPETKLPSIFPMPVRERQASWKRRCDRLWRERVRELKAAGLSESQSKDPEHFDWLAQHVVGRKSFGQIQLTAGHVTSRQAVADAVHRLADLIQLKLDRQADDSDETQGKK